MLTESFQHNDATVTIRRADVRARLKANLIYQTIGIRPDMPDDEWVELNFFARFLSQSTIEGDLGFPIPPVSGNADDLRACQERLMSADESLYEKINVALINVARNAGDPDLLPDADLSEAKKTIPSSGSDETTP